MTEPSLDPERIVQSAQALSRRINERFPQASLHRVSQQLVEVTRHAQDRAEWIARPILPLRIASGLLILTLIVGAVWFVNAVELPREAPPLIEFITAFEAGVNDLLLIGAGLFFLITAEIRIKRRRALDALHVLRTLAHLVDAHQLSKDPERVLARGELTPSTPRIELTSFELSRYLEYCSELEALIGKVAAVYGQGFADPVVIDAVSDVEQLTNGIASKIWQKLVILHSLDSSSQVIR